MFVTVSTKRTRYRELFRAFANKKNFMAHPAKA